MLKTIRQFFTPPVFPDDKDKTRTARIRYALIIAAYLFAFIILDFITKQFEGLPGVVAWYPPAGLTYTLLLVFGVGFAPAVTIALFISSLFIYRMPQPPYLLFLWAFVISLIYSLAAAFLRRRIRFDWQLRKLRDVAWLVFTTVFVSALLAILSVSSSALSSDMPRSEVLRAIFGWWIGETVGVLTITPFLLIFVMPGLKRFAEGQPVRLPAHRSFPRPTLSAIGQAASLAFILYWVFGVPLLNEFYPLYLITLPLIWIALDYGLKGVSAGLVALNFGVVLALWFFRFDPARMGELELLMIVNCIVNLLIGAVISERKQAEEALRESEDKFKYFFDHSTVGKSLTLPTGEVNVNQALCDMLGYTLPEFKDKKWQEITHAEDIEWTQKEVDQLLSGKRDSARFIKRFIHKDGSVVWVDLSSSMRRDKDGKPLYLMSSVIDITERVQAEEKIKSQLDELRRWQNVMLGREDRIQELKREVNEFCRRMGESIRYPSQVDSSADKVNSS